MTDSAVNREPSSRSPELGERPQFHRVSALGSTAVQSFLSNPSFSSAYAITDGREGWMPDGELVRRGVLTDSYFNDIQTRQKIDAYFTTQDDEFYDRLQVSRNTPLSEIIESYYVRSDSGKLHIEDATAYMNFLISYCDIKVKEQLNFEAQELPRLQQALQELIRSPSNDERIVGLATLLEHRRDRIRVILDDGFNTIAESVIGKFFRSTDEIILSPGLKDLDLLNTYTHEMLHALEKTDDGLSGTRRALRSHPRFAQLLKEATVEQLTYHLLYGKPLSNLLPSPNDRKVSYPEGLRLMWVLCELPGIDITDFLRAQYGSKAGALRLERRITRALPKTTLNKLEYALYLVEQSEDVDEEAAAYRELDRQINNLFHTAVRRNSSLRLTGLVTVMI